MLLAGVWPGWVDNQVAAARFFQAGPGSILGLTIVMGAVHLSE